jgi:hypothetical protein
MGRHTNTTILCLSHYLSWGMSFWKGTAHRPIAGSPLEPLLPPTLRKERLGNSGNDRKQW